MNISKRLIMHSNHIKDDACYSLNMQLMREAAHEIEQLRSALNDLLSGDVGKKTLDTLATGQGTNTDDGRAWMRAAAMLTHNVE